MSLTKHTRSLLFIILCVFISSCSFLQVGVETNLYKYKSYTLENIEYFPVTNLKLKSLDSFTFYYLVDFNCEKNLHPQIDFSKINFFLVDNSVINLKDFSKRIEALTNKNKFYYIPFKKYKNANKNFEDFVKILKSDFKITQNGYLISAKRKSL